MFIYLFAHIKQQKIKHEHNADNINRQGANLYIQLGLRLTIMCFCLKIVLNAHPNFPEPKVAS